ncbi:hypothetical protein FB464_2024 [Subtercola boreus]|nr:hypothetical protein FB464_2024 [Subtercola boreus]
MLAVAVAFLFVSMLLQPASPSLDAAAAPTAATETTLPETPAAGTPGTPGTPVALPADAADPRILAVQTVRVQTGRTLAVRAAPATAPTETSSRPEAAPRASGVRGTAGAPGDGAQLTGRTRTVLLSINRT